MNIQQSNITSYPLLSIVIPVLEPDDELSRCVYSIFGAVKNSSALEVVIVTQSKFVETISALYPRARVCSEKRRGIYSAMNDGVAVSRGEYLYFIGKDDVMLSTLRAALLMLLDVRPFALFCDVYWGSMGIYSGRPSRLRLLAKNLCHQGIIYSRDAFAKHGPYVRSMSVQADHLLNIKILWDRVPAGPIAYLPQPLSWYSGDGFSTVNRDYQFWRLYPQILKRYVGNWAKCLLIGYRLLRGVHISKSSNITQ